jgi:hypothetical protein
MSPQFDNLRPHFASFNRQQTPLYMFGSTAKIGRMGGLIDLIINSNVLFNMLRR